MTNEEKTREKLLHFLVERLGGHGVWIVPHGTVMPAKAPFNAFSIGRGKARATVLLQDVIDAATPIEDPPSFE